MNEKCYINTQYQKMNRAYCGFNILKGGFGESVTVTVFGTRLKGVLP
jgi:hypothetical protein